MVSRVSALSRDSALFEPAVDPRNDDPAAEHETARLGARQAAFDRLARRMDRACSDIARGARQVGAEALHAFKEMRLPASRRTSLFERARDSMHSSHTRDTAQCARPEQPYGARYASYFEPPKMSCSAPLLGAVGLGVGALAMGLLGLPGLDTALSGAFDPSGMMIASVADVLLMGATAYFIGHMASRTWRPSFMQPAPGAYAMQQPFAGQAPGFGPFTPLQGHFPYGLPFAYRAAEYAPPPFAPSSGNTVPPTDGAQPRFPAFTPATGGGPLDPAPSAPPLGDLYGRRDA